jgi:4-amino-4-deoxy-L-arabinose transferase-like glycosyltransferase
MADIGTRGLGDRTALLLVAGLLAAVFVAGIYLRPAFPVDETRYLSVSWEMHLSGDYFVPTKNGETYAHKPPLLFWLINLVWALTGVSEVAARLVGPAFAVLNLPLTWLLARRLVPERPDVAATAVAVLASLVVYDIYTGLTMFDAMLASATLLFLIGVWSAVREGNCRGWLLCGLALGFGALVKGPVILVHTLPVLLAVAAWADGRTALRPVLRGAGIALGIGLAVVACWLLPAVILGGEAYREELLWKQTAGRVANPFDHGRPFWFFAALVPVYLFPWSLHLAFWRSARALRPGDPAVRFLVIQALAGLIVFSLIASKQAHYLIPEMPVLSILVALAVTGRRWRLFENVGALLVLAGALLLLGLLAFGQLGDWQPRHAALGVGVLLIVIAATIAALWRGTPVSVAAWSLALVLSANLWISDAPVRDAYAMESFVAHFDGRDGKDIAYYGRQYNAEFNFAGRLTSDVALPAGRDELRAWAKDHPGGLVIAPVSALPDAGTPGTIVRYGKRDYGLWTSAALTK